MRNKKTLTLLVITLIVSTTISYNLLYFRFIPIDPDEGVLISDAERILDEPFPFLKFNLHVLGRYYLLALFYKFFGRTIAVERIMFIFIHCINNILIFFLARKIMPFHFSLIPVLLLLLVPGYWFKSFVALLQLTILFPFFYYLKSLSTKALLFCGFIIGASFWFRIDIAGYGAFDFGLVVLALALTKKISFKKAFQDLLLFSFIVFLTIAPMFLAYGIKKELSTPFTIIVNDIKVAQLQSSSFPGPSAFLKQPTKLLSKNKAIFFVYSSLFILFISGLVVFLRLIKKKSQEDLLTWFLLSIWILAILSFTHIWRWTSIFRLPQSGALIHVLSIFLLYKAFKNLFLKKPLPQTLYVGIFTLLLIFVQIYFVYYSFYGPSTIIKDASTLSQKNWPHLKLTSPKAGIAPPVMQARALNRVSTFIRKSTKPTEKIFCFGESVLYFLSDRKNATDFTNMMNMVVDSKSRAILKKQLISNPPKIIICKKFHYAYFKSYLPEIFDEISKRYLYFRTLHNYQLYFLKKNLRKKNVP